MSINITVPEDNGSPELKPRITVVGVGGAGGNAVNNMIAANLEGCDFIVANTDAQALTGSKADRRVQLGAGITKGLGAGSKPEVGRAAAEEAIDEVLSELQDSHMVFIAAGMGGGTGTGAAPVIARAAREQGILTVGVVTKPFQFEGSHRMRLAESGLDDLSQFVDTLIIIPNQNLFRVANEKTTFADAFKMADDVLYSGVRSITDLMVMPGLINLDFADVQSVMASMGRAMMGTGEAAGERRALDAAEAAISNPLLDDASMRGARGVLINITGGPDITLFEVDEAANRVRAEVDDDAYIIIGSAFDANLEGSMRVSVVAAGLEAAEGIEPSHVSMLGATQRIEPVRVPRPEEEPAAAEEIAEPAVAEADEPVEAVAVAPATETDEPLPDFLAGQTAASATEQPETAAPVEPMAAETPAAPASTPGLGATETFIPTKPVEVEAEDDTDLGAADPFKVADLVNGSKPAEGDVADQNGPKKTNIFKRVQQKGKLSLFERVTGTGRAEKDPAAEGTVDALAKPRVVERPVEPRPVEATPARPAAVESAPEPAATGPKLGAVDPADRIPSTELEDDLLDIPAFLRRQAN